MTSAGMARFGRNITQFIRFGIVGGSGVVVNMVVMILAKKIAYWGWGITEHDAAINLLGTQFHIRWYHIFMTIAFLVANVWNYQLNRMWTFKGKQLGSWWRGFLSFLLTGLVAFLVSQVVATLLMNPVSPLALPSDVFDDSTGFRTKVYWANAIATVVAMPVNFIINKVWTFRKPKAAKTKVVKTQQPA